MALSYNEKHIDYWSIWTIRPCLTEAVIKQVKKASPQAISRFKEYCRNMDSTNSAELIAELRASDEGQEGLSAFLEKRPPSWAK